MNKPTKSQWKGYAVLSVVLVTVLLMFIFMPRSYEKPTPVDYSELSEALEKYGDTMTAQIKYERQHYRQRYSRDNHHTFGYDTTYRNRQQQTYERRQVTVELNAADTAELQQLYGIGPTFARRIVKYRSLLGGFVRKEQLMEVYGMTEDRYQAIADHVTVDLSGVVKINPNAATVDELRRHPYLDYYQAKAIVQFRERGNNFTSVDDLLKVNLMDNTTLEKLRGYIQF